MWHRSPAEPNRPAEGRVGDQAQMTQILARKQMRINARSTGSGTNSVLMEPCRKNSRSGRDHVGTWTFSNAADLPSAPCPARSPVAQEIKLRPAGRTNRVRNNRVAFIRETILRSGAT